MGICSLHHAVTPTIVGPDLESQLKSFITDGCSIIQSKEAPICPHGMIPTSTPNI